MPQPLLLNYLHTVRHLRADQLWFQLVRRLRVPTVYRSEVRTAGMRPGELASWQLPARRIPSMTAATAFRFLNLDGSLDEHGWTGAGREKLWRYNQHYFDDLNAADAQSRALWHRQLVQKWISDNPAAAGDGWEAYPTSLRIVNWIKWHLSGNALDGEMLNSLASQARWLCANIEYHILGNHLISNAKALVFAGCFLSGSEPDQWRQLGLEIIEREFGEQILPDGGNYERSPMYHALFLEDVLDLINLASVYKSLLAPHRVGNWRTLAASMLDWLSAMTHPDGEIAHFNDCALDIAPRPQEIARYASDLEIARPSRSTRAESVSAQFLDASGYVRVDTPSATAMLDVAPLGPDYLPAHGHADTLSFELSIGAERIIVNGGTSCYGSGNIRLVERGTTSHSTVTVDGENSSAVWGGFRVAQRAYPFGMEISQTPDCVMVGCSHDGYRRLSGKPIHRRSWQFHDNSLAVADTITGRHGRATAKFLLHPAVRVNVRSEGEMTLTTKSGQTVRIRGVKGVPRLESAFHSSRFGERLATIAICVDLIDGESELLLDWQDRLSADGAL